MKVRQAGSKRAQEAPDPASRKSPKIPFAADPRIPRGGDLLQ
jgi:hypothetical protein